MGQSTQGLQRFIDLLSQYAARYPHESHESDVIERCVKLARVGQSSLSRHHFKPGHFTSSAWLLNSRADAVLLTHHKKLNRWLQLGGHIEAESSADWLSNSIREAKEESGIEAIRVLSDQLIDIDIHEIPSIKGDPAHQHFDGRFLLQTAHDDFQVSSESNALRWVKLTELPQLIDEESMLRLHRKTLDFLGSR